MQQPKDGKMKNLSDKTERRGFPLYGRSCQTGVDLGAFVLKKLTKWIGNDELSDSS
jgi:hypothetical protein